MARPTAQLPLQALRTLQRLGERIRLARRRRRLTAALVAQRAGMTPFTLRRIEQGAPGATMGAYVGVLHVLGLDVSIDEVAKADNLGRALQDASLGAPTKPSQKWVGDRLTASPKLPDSGPELYPSVRAGASQQPTKTSQRRDKQERIQKNMPIHINDLLKLVDRP
jgi:transcriptional regulator with XRE-family HTH domain